VCGYLPYEDANTAKLYDKILHADYKTPRWISNAVRDLLGKMFVTDPARRYTIADIRRHPWFTQIMTPAPTLKSAPASTGDLIEPVVSECVRMGLDRGVLTDNLLRNAHNNITATYYLLAERMMRTGELAAAGALSALARAPPAAASSSSAAGGAGVPAGSPPAAAAVPMLSLPVDTSGGAGAGGASARGERPKSARSFNISKLAAQAGAASGGGGAAAASAGGGGSASTSPRPGTAMPSSFNGFVSTPVSGAGGAIITPRSASTTRGDGRAVSPRAAGAIAGLAGTSGVGAGMVGGLHSVAGGGAAGGGGGGGGAAVAFTPLAGSGKAAEGRPASTATGAGGKGEGEVRLAAAPPPSVAPAPVTAPTPITPGIVPSSLLGVLPGGGGVARPAAVIITPSSGPATSKTSGSSGGAAARTAIVTQRLVEMSTSPDATLVARGVAAAAAAVTAPTAPSGGAIAGSSGSSSGGAVPISPWSSDAPSSSTGTGSNGRASPRPGGQASAPSPTPSATSSAATMESGHQAPARQDTAGGDVVPSIVPYLPSDVQASAPPPHAAGSRSVSVGPTARRPATTAAGTRGGGGGFSGSASEGVEPALDIASKLAGVLTGGAPGSGRRAGPGAGSDADPGAAPSAEPFVTLLGSGNRVLPHHDDSGGGMRPPTPAPGVHVDSIQPPTPTSAAHSGGHAAMTPARPDSAATATAPGHGFGLSAPFPGAGGTGVSGLGDHRRAPRPTPPALDVRSPAGGLHPAALDVGATGLAGAWTGSKTAQSPAHSVVSAVSSVSSASGREDRLDGESILGAVSPAASFTGSLRPAAVSTAAHAGVDGASTRSTRPGDISLSLSLHDRTAPLPSTLPSPTLEVSARSFVSSYTQSPGGAGDAGGSRRLPSSAHAPASPVAPGSPAAAYMSPVRSPDAPADTAVGVHAPSPPSPDLPPPSSPAGAAALAPAHAHHPPPPATAAAAVSVLPSGAALAPTQAFLRYSAVDAASASATRPPSPLAATAAAAASSAARSPSHPATATVAPAVVGLPAQPLPGGSGMTMPSARTVTPTANRQSIASALASSALPSALAPGNSRPTSARSRTPSYRPGSAAGGSMASPIAPASAAGATWAPPDNDERTLQPPSAYVGPSSRPGSASGRRGGSALGGGDGGIPSQPAGGTPTSSSGMGFSGLSPLTSAILGGSAGAADGSSGGGSRRHPRGSGSGSGSTGGDVDEFGMVTGARSLSVPASRSRGRPTTAGGSSKRPISASRRDADRDVDPAHPPPADPAAALQPHAPARPASRGGTGAGPRPGSSMRRFKPSDVSRNYPMPWKETTATAPPAAAATNSTAGHATSPRGAGSGGAAPGMLAAAVAAATPAPSPPVQSALVNMLQRMAVAGYGATGSGDGALASGAWMSDVGAATPLAVQHGAGPLGHAPRAPPTDAPTTVTRRPITAADARAMSAARGYVVNRGATAAAAGAGVGGDKPSHPVYAAVVESYIAGVTDGTGGTGGTSDLTGTGGPGGHVTSALANLFPGAQLSRPASSAGGSGMHLVPQPPPARKAAVGPASFGGGGGGAAPFVPTAWGDAFTGAGAGGDVSASAAHPRYAGGGHRVLRVSGGGASAAGVAAPQPPPHGVTAAAGKPVGAPAYAVAVGSRAGTPLVAMALDGGGAAPGGRAVVGGR